MRRATLLLATSLLSLGLSGCVGTESKADSKPSEMEPAFDEQSGSIQGIVMNDELFPIPFAQVGIVEPHRTTTTDADGRFFLNFVPPGTHRVLANAIGYSAATTSVDVVAGEVTSEVRIVLVKLAAIGPYHTTGIFNLVVGGYMVKATPDCMYPVPGQSTYKTCVGGFFCRTGPCEVHYGHCDDGGAYSKYGCDFTPEWKTIIGEVAWKPATGVTGRGWLYEVLAPNITRANPDSGSVDQSDKRDWITISSKSPIRTWIDDAAMAERGVAATDRCGGKAVEYPRCDWAWRIFPGWCTVGGLSGEIAGCNKTGPDFAVDYDGNRVSVYFSYFIQDAAPTGWSALPDS